MEQYLEHHGILGQKWGVRRYQNPDGSLTTAGKNRYGGENTSTNSNNESKGMSEKTKKAIKIGAAVVGTAAVTAGLTYAGYKFNVKVKNMASDKIIKSGEMIAQKYLDDGRLTYSKIMSSGKDFDSFNRLDRIGKVELGMADYKAKTVRNKAADEAKKVSKSFVDSYKRVYGKEKYKLSDFELESMGIKTFQPDIISIDKLPIKEQIKYKIRR